MKPRLLVAGALLATAVLSPVAASGHPVTRLATVAGAYLPGLAPIDPTPSLPSVTDGARPGPDQLYAAQPDAPQLENHDPRFKAQPLLVSGTEAYDQGEYLYQDYLYDDHGSDAMPVSATNQTVNNSTELPLPNGEVDPNALNHNVGTIEYPTDPVYAGNAADLVEFRTAVGADSTAFRFTLNTLKRADTTIIALALDTDTNATTGTSTLPRNPGAPFPGTDVSLTTWGTGAEISRFSALGTLISTTPVAVNTDLSSAQITVTVPHSAYDPTGVVSATLATGLYNASNGGWLMPAVNATATTPGGAGTMDPTPSGIFNLGFRFDERVQHQNAPPDEEQAGYLANHDPSADAHQINFGSLDAGTVSSTVPETGLQIRMFASHTVLSGGGESDVTPHYLSQLQPYSVYIPTSGALSHPHQLQLYLHSNGEAYYQYDGSLIMQQLGEVHDAVVLSVAARGFSTWYIGPGEADVFEAWNDVARHVLLDPSRVAIGGYSMGGYATYRLGGLYPDLFGKAFSAMGPPGKQIWIPPAAPTDGIQTLTNLWLENTRNLPYLNYAETADELVPQIGPLTQNQGTPGIGTTSFNQLGYRYNYVLFSGGEHYTLAILGYNFPMGEAFTANAVVDRNPAHVTYAQVPAAGEADLGLNHDHAYWVSGVHVADLSAGAGAKGVIDARSEGFGVGDPTTVATRSAGVENLDYVATGLAWNAAPVTPVLNKVDITMGNLSTARLQLDRAKLSAQKGPLTLVVTADRAASLTLADSTADASAVGTKDGAGYPAIGTAGGLVSLPIVAGTHTYVLTAAAVSTATVTAAKKAAATVAAETAAAKRAVKARAARLAQPHGTLAYTGEPAILGFLGLLLAGLGVGSLRLARREKDLA